jgi:hypothetical protein
MRKEIVSHLATVIEDCDQVVRDKAVEALETIQPYIGKEEGER